MIMVKKQKKRSSSTTSFKRAGARVCIQPTPAFRRQAKQGIIHKTRKCGVLMEDGRIGPGAGWDVYDIRLANGRETSAYGFDIRPLGRHNKSDARKRR
jgi:hypothetical protein